MIIYIRSYAIGSMLGGIGCPHPTQGLIRRKILNIGKGLETPPPSSESFSASLHLDKEERHKRRRVKSSPLKSMGNDAMSKALRQISKSPFTRKIDKAKLPHHFAQSTFTIYNGRIDRIEHVSHFNQKMAIHSRNEALMCKVFPSSLGPVV